MCETMYNSDPEQYKKDHVDMYLKIERVEKIAKRGLISAEEAEQRINEFIDEACPYYAKDHMMGIDEYNANLEQRRIANRRKWKFLLELTKEPVIV